MGLANAIHNYSNLCYGVPLLCGILILLSFELWEFPQYIRPGMTISAHSEELVSFDTHSLPTLTLPGKQLDCGLIKHRCPEFAQVYDHQQRKALRCLQAILPQ